MEPAAVTPAGPPSEGLWVDFLPDGHRLADLQHERLEIPDLELGAEIGRGGMGVVFHGRQIYIGRAVAVKVMALDSDAGKADFLSRFQREATILAGLTHPNIVACHQAGVTASGRPYLVMEYIDGPSLRAYLNEHGAMPEALAIEIVRTLAIALGHALQCGIIHRDVKAENVLLNRVEKSQRDKFPFTVKLVDLGLARATQSTSQDHVTMTGMCAGTPATMAPEQFDAAAQVDFKADIYGLGCLMYHMLTGKPAFATASLTEVVRAKVVGAVPNPAHVNRRLQGGTVDLVKDMLARDPERRPASYQDIIARCCTLASILHAARPHRRRLVTVMIVFALAVAVAGIGWVRSPDAHPALDVRKGTPSQVPTAPALPLDDNARVVPQARSGKSGPTASSTAPTQEIPINKTDRPPAMDAPSSLAVRMQWTKVGEAAWDNGETDASSLVGISGEIRHELRDGLWRVDGVLVLANGVSGKTDGASVAIIGADGTRYEVVVKNRDSAFVTMTRRIDPDGNVTTFHTDVSPPHDLRFSIMHLTPRFLAVEMDGVPREHVMGLPAAALPLRAIALHVDSTAGAGHGRLEVRDFTITYDMP